MAALLVAVGCLLAALAETAGGPTASMFGAGTTLLSAPEPAFHVWWAIIPGLLTFVVWQWLPAHRTSRRLAAVAWPALVAGVAHLGWVLAGRAELVIATVAVLVVELVALCLVVWRLAKYPSPSWLEHLTTDVGWGFTLGWVTVEALIAVGVVVEAYELATDRLYLIVAISACVVFVAGALGLAGRMYHQFAVGLALLWGFGWIGWARLTGEPRNYLLGGLVMAGAFVILAGFYASGARRRKYVVGLEGRPWR